MTMACLLALVGAAAPLATVAADAPAGTCTLSYPATCTVRADDVRVTCSGVGAVPECDV